MEIKMNQLVGLFRLILAYSWLIPTPMPGQAAPP